jgi:beta-1,4-mannooligosaccharide/beta-1,4-mannosyl-N-acetylglucosamine phosphorylase
VGAGPVPIEKPEGWLLFYNGVLTSCNGFVYSFGAALLDLEKPWKVIYRGSTYLLSPQTYYECVGDVPNVAFPCATLFDQPTGRIAIYYGGADMVARIRWCGYGDRAGFLQDRCSVGFPKKQLGRIKGLARPW